MNHSAHEHFRDLLLKMRKDIIAHMDGIRQEEAETSLRDEDGDNSSIGMHLADQGTDCMAQAQNFIFVEYDSRVLYQIEQALDRIEKNQYGLCDFCGCDISENRLEAIPYAALCRSCQEKEEGMYNDRERYRDFSMADEDMNEFY